METPSNYRDVLVEAVFEKMLDFRPDPTDNINFEGQYLTDTGKMLVDLSRKIVGFTNPDDFGGIMSEIEDFGLYLRDPVEYQRAVDEKIEDERRAKAEEREANRKTPVRRPSKVERSSDVISEGVEEVNGLLEAMI